MYKMNDNIIDKHCLTRLGLEGDSDGGPVIGTIVKESDNALDQVTLDIEVPGLGIIKVEHSFKSGVTKILDILDNVGELSKYPQKETLEMSDITLFMQMSDQYVEGSEVIIVPYIGD